MKRLFVSILLWSLIVGLPGCRPGGEEAVAQTGSQTKPEPATDKLETKGSTVMELVGTLRRPASEKHAYRLEIYPAGNLKVIELLGDALRKIPDKTAVRVRGVVRSQVVGPAKGDADQYPVQWGVWLRVSEVQSFATLDEAFRESRERHLRERDR